jgi:hypothetical protein
VNSVEKREDVMYGRKEGALRSLSTKTEVASQPQQSEDLSFPLCLLDTTACFIVSKASRDLLSTHSQKSRRLERAFVRLREAKIRRDAGTDSCRVADCI